MPATTSPDPAGAGWIVGEGTTPLWHVAPAERLSRQLRACGLATVVYQADAVPAGIGSVVLLRADIAYDPALIQALVQRPGLALSMPESDEIAGLTAPPEVARALAENLAAGRLTTAEARNRDLTPLAPAEAAGRYRSALRKREPPFLARVRADQRRPLERRLYGSAYKGVTDLVTKYLWPEPAFWATQACARLGLTPNMVTFASLLLVILAFWLFARGDFATGLVAAWLMTFLDTVDGKLARVTVTHSRFGNIFDHGIDLIHPPFWYWAWMMGLAATGAAPAEAGLLLAVIVAGYVLQRLAEGLFIARHRLEMHVWRRFDSRFRLVTARRNPNLLILTAALLAGRPDLGIAAVAVWTAVCLLVHVWQLLQAEFARRRGPLQSWLVS